MYRSRLSRDFWRRRFRLLQQKRQAALKKKRRTPETHAQMLDRAALAPCERVSSPAEQLAAEVSERESYRAAPHDIAPESRVASLKQGREGPFAYLEKVMIRHG